MNEMQVLQNVFPEMTTFEWLERAYRNARKIKRYRDEILAFSNDLDGNLLKIQKELRDETFRFEAYRRHWIYVPKKRVVMALPFYSRIAQYMDDIVILAPDKETANRYRAIIDKFLYNRLRLDLNNKTSIRPATRVEFVGYLVTARALRLRKPTVRRIKSAFRGICKRYFAGDLTPAEFNRRVASYKGMIEHCENEGLRTRLNEIYLHAKEAHYKGSE